MPAVVEDALGGITPYGTRRVWMKGCDVLKFFSRCRILSHVMTGISVVMGMLILFELLPLHDYDDRALLFLMARILLFVLSVFSVILLKCLIRDAQEDLEAVMRYRAGGGITGDEDRAGTPRGDGR